MFRTRSGAFGVNGKACVNFQMQRQPPFLIKLYSHCVQGGCPSMTQHTHDLQIGVICCSQGKG